MTIFKLINGLIKKHIPFVLLSLLMALLTILSSVGMLSSSTVLISKAALHPDVLELMVLIVAVRFFGLSRGIFRYLERIISHNTTFKILSSLRLWFFKSFSESYSENNKRFKTGKIYTKLVNDIDTLKDFFLRVVYPFITAVLTGIATALFISYFSKTASAVFMLIYTGDFVLPLILFRLTSRSLEKERFLKESINIKILDIVNGVTESSFYNFKVKLSKDYYNLRHELTAIQKKKNALTTFCDNLHGLSVTVLIAITLYITVPLVTNRSLNGIYYAMLPMSMLASFEALIPIPNLLFKYKECSIASSSLFSVLKTDDCSKSAKGTIFSNSHLIVEKLCVLDTGSGKPLLKNISFNLPEGKKLAVVGMSGSGKSTLLKVLMGFMNFKKGEIKLGGENYEDQNIDEIRKQFSYIEQNPYLFNASLKENLLIAYPEASENAILEVLETSCSSSFADGLPDGVNTLLGEFGSKLSGGERQRLAIARTLLKDSPILLLDEPTASLDVELEEKIISSIHNFIGTKSCIWITHRLVHMDLMDEIIVLDKGEVVERGTHGELLSKRGLYSRLWNLQTNCWRIIDY